MKKFVRNTIGAFMALSLVAGAISCSDGLDESDPFVEAGVVNKPTNSSSSGSGSGGNGGSGNGGNSEVSDEYETVELTQFAGKTTSWDKGDQIVISADDASKLTVGSKVYFDVAKNGDYLKFHVDNGNWGAVGVTEYFNADGSKVAGAAEDPDNPGVYNIDVGDGVYYIEVTDSNIDKLKAGFALHGNAVINKITMKIKKASAQGNQGGESGSGQGQEQGGGQEASTRSVSGSAVEFTVAADSASKVSADKPVNVVLQYIRANKDEAAIKIDPAELKIYKGDEFVKTVEKIEGFSLNVWGGAGNAFDATAVTDGQAMAEDNCKCYQLKIALPVTSVSAGDKIKVHLVSGTVVGSCGSLANENLKASIMVGDESLNGWSFSAIVTSDSAATPAPGGDSESAAETVAKKIKLVKNIYADGGAAQTQVKIATGCDSLTVGDKVKLTMKGTADKALGHTEMMIVDATKAANYWTELSEKIEVEIDATFEVSKEFTITKVPVGAGSESMMLAINGLDGDETVNLSCTEFKIEKVAGTESTEPAPQTDPEETPAADPETPASDPETPVVTKPAGTVKEVTTVNNEYSTSKHGIQAKVAVRPDDKLNGLAVGDKITVVMKGVSTKDFTPQFYFMDNTDAGGYSNLWDWGDSAELKTTGFEVTKEITLKKAPTSDETDAFVFVIDYDETGATADLENATIYFTEFSVTKEVAENQGVVDPAPAAADTTIWTGEAELDWAKGDASGDVINKDKFAGKTFVGLKFTISSFVQDATTIRIMAQDDWTDITPFESAEGDCMIANGEDDNKDKALWVWGSSATVKFSDANIERIKNNGIKFYGTGVTITKVELVTE